ncbi:hypothetical protein [Streptomyces sp. NPDC046942]|uniref:hypothetical protein n=1 Tax=Streptomyces sp. NPDC046942 TaxID=3155137 RepID=UPI0034027AC4
MAEFAHRYGERINGWTIPASRTKRDRLALVFGQDALTQCRTAWADDTPPWIRQALDVTRIRRPRYRHLPKDRLQHTFSATAINAARPPYWSAHPLGHTRSSRLTRLSYQLAG